MAYRSPQHHELRVVVSSWNSSLEWVERACTLRAMKFREHVDLTAAPKWAQQEETLTASLSQSLQADVLEFAAQRCEAIAEGFITGLKQPDIKLACKA